ncbi:hypothetical protein GTZ99_03005 [Novosphingobium sp. FSY-8]|uniref:Small CPxCG-related zinc finger protein n=1 Tax=Novosphingobium ovatum TaxID=1908523 RepID=A0ABW9XAJ4_9SPHN|nr:hypothetical protein [Novosphingobium ovatum]NBC35520.1 hypothetical protein [Novosphingobium ovatum]
MPHPITHSRLSPGAVGRPIPQPIALVICTGCEAEAFTKPGHLPHDWQVEAHGDMHFAFCPDCAIDLPKGDGQ